MMLISESMSQMVGCHFIKSSSLKPVVLCNDAVLKNALRRAVAKSMWSAYMSMPIMLNAATKNITRKQRNSSSCNTSRTRRLIKNK